VLLVKKRAPFSQFALPKNIQPLSHRQLAPNKVVEPLIRDIFIPSRPPLPSLYYLSSAALVLSSLVRVSFAFFQPERSSE
jgi:hypothetical protein